ncbi:MAG: phosphoribosylamine--glycine ligase, partial [Rickettsiales bacterium]|nr:phosphoribosylamine--glycine ligase [Rickettsiales bacterium]
KGVIIAHSEKEAFEAVDDILGGKFGSAGNKLVIEEFLEGEELSFFALVNGKTVLPLGSAQDHKAVGEGDTGPNTGGMGTYSPAPVMDEALERAIMEQFIKPTAKGMVQEGRSYKGILFAGFMITAKGPMLLEYNVRFGDPETQSILSRLDSDLLELIEATVNNQLDAAQVRLSNNAALCVVMAANGYPGSYQKGTEIKGLDQVSEMDGVNVFHAGTKSENGTILANGGRVLGVTAMGRSIIEAQQKAYHAVDAIDWADGFCRRDIGWRAVDRAKKNAS